MYISNVHIENFRNFEAIDIPLKQFSIIIGCNDVGKSNLSEAINILLYNNKGNYYSKVLSKYDFNIKAICLFKKILTEEYQRGFSVEGYSNFFYSNAPKIVIRLRFVDAKTEYEKALLRDWVNGDENQLNFDIEFQYYFDNKRRLKDTMQKLLDQDMIAEHYNDFDLFLDCYSYKYISPNNGKEVNYSKIKNFISNCINAERDAFSNDESLQSSRMITKIIEKGLSFKDKVSNFNG